jgi:hypothetical protein
MSQAPARPAPYKPGDRVVFTEDAEDARHIERVVDCRGSTAGIRHIGGS